MSVNWSGAWAVMEGRGEIFAVPVQKANIYRYGGYRVSHIAGNYDKAEKWIADKLKEADING